MTTYTPPNPHAGTHAIGGSDAITSMSIGAMTLLNPTPHTTASTLAPWELAIGNTANGLAYTATTPAVMPPAGTLIGVIRGSNSTNSLFIEPNAGQTVGGQSQLTAPSSITTTYSQGQGMILASDGVSNWDIVSAYGSDWGRGLTVTGTFTSSGASILSSLLLTPSVVTAATDGVSSSTSNTMRFYNAASNNIAISLSFSGSRIYWLKRIDTSTNTVVITPATGTIEGQTSWSLLPGRSILVALQGTDYKIIASFNDVGSLSLTQINPTTSGTFTANIGDIINTSAASTITLPANPMIGQCVSINRGNHVALVTINANSGQTINGSSTSCSIVAGGVAYRGQALFIAKSSTDWIALATGTDLGYGLTLGAGLTATGLVSIQNAMIFHQTSKSATYTTLSSDIWIRATSGTWTLTLTVNSTNLVFVTNEGTGVITVAGASGAVNGVTTLNPGDSAVYLCTGTTWDTIASYVANPTLFPGLLSLTQINSSTSGTIAANIGDIVNTTGAATITLPANPVIGDCVQVNRGNHVALITINTNSGQTINGTYTTCAMSASGAGVYRGQALFIAQSSTVWQALAIGTDLNLGIDVTGSASFQGTASFVSLVASGQLVLSRQTETANFSTGTNRIWYVVTANTVTATLTTSSNTQFIILTNEGSGIVGVQASTGSVNGVQALNPGDSVLYLCNGTNWDTIASFNGTGSQVIGGQISTAHTLTLADAGGVVTMNNSSANTVTVPVNLFPVGTRIDIIQLGTGTTSIVAASGVTINTAIGLNLAGQYQGATLLQVNTNTWVLIGALSA